MLCAWDDSKVIATASFEPYGNPTRRAISPAYVGNLYVDAEYRSQGIGSQIIAARESLAHEHGVNLLISEVHQRNAKAKKFLRSQGFVRTGGLRINSIHGNLVQSFCKGI